MNKIITNGYLKIFSVSQFGAVRAPEHNLIGSLLVLFLNLISIFACTDLHVCFLHMFFFHLIVSAVQWHIQICAEGGRGVSCLLLILL